VEGVVGAYPVRSELDAPLEVARWRPLFAWLVAIPHLIVLGVLSSIVDLVVIIAWFAILFTGRMPKAIFGLIALYLRYQWRTMTYALGLHAEFPPWDFELVGDDPTDGPATVDVVEPGELSRGLIWVKWLLAFPHYLALCFVYIAAFFAWGIGALVVLFTGRWPEGIREFLLGTGRWTNRLYAYLYLVTDEYPPLSTQ
jgi:hypothetical protein